MSNILGLHFGHDANVTVIKNGKVAGYALRERLDRRKHAYSVNSKTLEMALTRAGVCINDINGVVITSTQGCEPILFDLPYLDIEYAPNNKYGQNAYLAKEIGCFTDPFSKKLVTSMAERVLCSPPDLKIHPAFKWYLDPYKNIPIEDLRRFPWLETHIVYPEWRRPEGLELIANIPVKERISDPRARLGFHYPVRVKLFEKWIDGVTLDHHMAHAASSYYRSGSNCALVVTNDGYGGIRTPFSNGGVYFGINNRLIALAPHYLTHGYLFDSIGRYLGLGSIGAAGKLMGLAPYGSPTYFDSALIGDRTDWENAGVKSSAKGWINHAMKCADKMNHSIAKSDEDYLPFSEFELNLASSTQKIFEETWLRLVRLAQESIRKSNIEVDSLCLSGGSALNCPANSRLAKETGFPHVFIEPNCDDGGLSTGAALWFWHTILDQDRPSSVPLRSREVYCPAYSPTIVKDSLNELNPEEKAEYLEDWFLHAAKELSRGNIIAWFEGGAEIGPRALGHRSLLADPRLVSMKLQLNNIKNREQWRPFAPTVLEHDAKEYFDFSNMESKSPFMLRTCKVTNPILSAITHVDGTARVQTVSPGNGDIYKLLQAFKSLTGVPVLINTSMNVAGEPIVETPNDAIRFFRRTEVSTLYMDNWRISRTIKC